MWHIKRIHRSFLSLAFGYWWIFNLQLHAYIWSPILLLNNSMQYQHMVMSLHTNWMLLWCKLLKPLKRVSAFESKAALGLKINAQEKLHVSMMRNHVHFKNTDVESFSSWQQVWKICNIFLKGHLTRICIHYSQSTGTISVGVWMT
jgi:hypothetical protein